MFKKIGLLILLLIISFVIYTVISTGFFRRVENTFDGEIIKRIPIPGAEDITVSVNDSFALISSTNRRVYPPIEEEIGGIYLMNLKTGNFEFKQVSPIFSRSFAPHGISMIKTNNGYHVMAINHTLTGHSIEVFKLINDSLLFERSLTNKSMISPNDIVMVDENHFYFTNDHGYTKGFGKLLEEYVGLPASDVVYFDGQNYRVVADAIAYANGINFDKKRNLIFVASPRKFLIKVYSKTSDGSLEFIEDIPCGMGVDNIELDTDGNLWAAGHPNLLKFKAYAQGKEKTSPSEIVKINYRSKNDFTVEQIYSNDGSIISASSVAASYGDFIIAGNVMDTKLLILKRGR